MNEDAETPKHSYDDGSAAMGKKNKAKGALPAPAVAAPALSAKRLKTNQSLVRSLHVTTKAVEKIAKNDDGTLFVPGRVTGATKGDLWDFQSPAAEEVAFQPLEIARYPPVSPALEFQRHKASQRSREHLSSQCRSIGGVNAPPTLAWERWQGDCQMNEGGAGGGNAAAAAAGRDYLLPGNPNFVSKHLLEDLERGGVKPENARRIAASMAEHSLTLVRSISSSATPSSSSLSSSSSNKAATVTVVQHKHSYDISLSNVNPEATARLLKLNVRHYAKLSELHRLHSARRGAAVESASAPSFPPSPAFAADLYSLLSRYNSLLGHGMQCALPEDVFRCLKRRLHVSFECFASPLNCRFPAFCSAFPDVDAPFGSVGSFFEGGPKSSGGGGFFPSQGGSFEVNPPFIEGIMYGAVQKLSRLLREISAPLSFCVIVPGWADSPSFKALSSSSHLAYKCLVAAADHGYVDGAQHQRQDRFLAAPYDTMVYILQNDTGRAKFGGWRDAGFEKELRDAFAKGIPTKAMVERRLKAGRGFGDRDGGGGVFKGKKKKRSGGGGS